jgi:hypothetical protein
LRDEPILSLAQLKKAKGQYLWAFNHGAKERAKKTFFPISQRDGGGGLAA